MSPPHLHLKGLPCSHSILNMISLNPIALRKAKTVCNFGLSEGKRVKRNLSLNFADINFLSAFWHFRVKAYVYTSIFQKETALVTSYSICFPE